MSNEVLGQVACRSRAVPHRTAQRFITSILVRNPFKFVITAKEK